MNPITLDSFHDQSIDGLVFCGMTYQFLEQVRSTPEGLSRLRMRSTDAEKRLVEELLPIAQFTQAKYRPGRYISIRWVNGSQNFDGHLNQVGFLVDRALVPNAKFIEATCAVDSKEYLGREAIDRGQVVYGLDGLYRPSRYKVDSVAVVRSGYDFVDAFAKIVVEQIRKKSAKDYPSDTALVVQCNLGLPYVEDEWNRLVSFVRDQIPSHSFSEIYLFDSILYRDSSI